MRLKEICIKTFIATLTTILLLSTNGLTEINISTYTVDGIHNNPEVVIHNRQPIFSFDYSGTISSFTIKVTTATAGTSPDEYTLDTSTVWVIHTTTTNVSLLNLGENNFRARITYAGLPLELRTTYYSSLTAYDQSGSSATEICSFYTVVSSITMNFSIDYDLQVDWNNPFNPDIGQITKFRYIFKGAGDIKKKVKVRIYTLTGEYVTTAKHYAPLSDDINWYEASPNIEYTAEWNGTDSYGEIVPLGLYLVNLAVDGESKGITKIVIVKRRKDFYK